MTSTSTPKIIPSSSDTNNTNINLSVNSNIDDGRPAGGTARASGTKTPLKVQWALTESPLDSTHALDEHGLDPNAFETLTHALERHRSSASDLPSHIAISPSVPPPTHPNHDDRHTHPVPIVAVTHLEIGANKPHARPAPVNFGPDGSKVTDYGYTYPPPTQSAITPPHGNGTENGASTNTNTTASSPTTTAPFTPPQAHGPLSVDGPTYQIPGEAFIDRDEQAGLPGTRDLEGYAKEVVRAHSRKGKRGWNKSFAEKEKEKTGDKKNKRSGKERQRPDHRTPHSDNRVGRSDDDMDLEAAPEPMHAPLRMGGGVLAALLTLYNNNNRNSNPELRNQSTSNLTSARSSMDVSDLLHSSDPNPDCPCPSELDPNEPVRPWINAPIPQKLKLNLASEVGAKQKRPGFKLSRLSLESNLPTRNSLGSRIPAVRRPSSVHFGRSHQHGNGDNEDVDENETSPVSESGTTTISSGERDSTGGAITTGTTSGGARKWPEMLSLKDLKHANSSFHSLKSFAGIGMAGVGAGVKSAVSSEGGTPTTEGEEWDDKWMTKEREKEKERIRKEEKKKKKKAEAFITRHVAEVIQRQEFILKLTRALMMFGGPSHRLQAQIQATARVLDLELSCMYLPDVMLLSFDDGSTGTSSIKFIRQGSALDLGKLYEGFKLYWKVIHDKISVSEASAELDILMRRQPFYNFWQLIFIGGMCSAAISTVSFSGSFVDALISMPMGSLLVAIQLLSVRNELYSNVFEITVATLLSFLAAVFAGTRHFCYSSVASSSVVLILPGYIVTLGALELTSRSIVSGAVRLCFAAVYSLFLGFGLAIGVEVYEKITGQSIVGSQDYLCQQSHDPNGPWWQQTPSLYWTFLTVPLYPLFLSLRNQAPYNRKELLFSVAIACVGWVTNHFVGTKFINQNDISAAVGAFAVGFISNIYGRFFGGNAFVVMITGILFQVPSGLSNGGLLQFASQQTAGSSNAYLSGFQTALQLISVAIGLTVGLSISLVVVHPIQSKRRAAGIFSL